MENPTPRVPHRPPARLILAACLGAMGLWAAQAADTAPTNDRWSDAADVSGKELSLEADLNNATAELFEAIREDQWGHTVWWRWTVPADGVYEWDTAGSHDLVAVSVWSLDALGQLVARSVSTRRSETSIADGLQVHVDSQGSFPAIAGETLWLSADAAYIRSYGLLVLPPVNPFSPGGSYPVRIAVHPSAEPAPVNDRFADRTVLTGNEAVLRFRLNTATGEDNEPRLPGDSLQRTRWWTWQAPGDGTARLRNVGAEGAPVFGVYQRTVWQHLELRALSTTQFGNDCFREFRGRDVLEWDVVAGGQYELQADRYPWNLPNAEFQMALEFIPAPANDRLANALPLEGNEVHRVVSNAGATRNPEDAPLPGRSGNGSIWFRWSAPERGVLQVVTNEPLRFSEPTFEVLPPGGSWSGFEIVINVPNPCGGPMADLFPPAPFIPALGIFQVSGVQGGREILALQGYGTNAAVAEVDGEVRIQLDGLSDSSGETPLNLLFTPPPTNDRFENRIALPSAPVRAGGRTFAARPFYGSPVSGRPAWWQWTAPTSGLWVLRPKTDAPHHRTWLLRGAEYSVNIPARSTTWPPLTFQATAGEVFQIVAVATEGYGDNVSFQIEPAVAPVITLERRSEVRGQDWTLLDTFEFPSGFDLPRVVETSTDLEHWTEQCPDDRRFAAPVSRATPALYRVRLLDTRRRAGGRTVDINDNGRQTHGPPPVRSAPLSTSPGSTGCRRRPAASASVRWWSVRRPRFPHPGRSASAR